MQKFNRTKIQIREKKMALQIAINSVRDGTERNDLKCIGLNRVGGHLYVFAENRAKSSF